MTSPPLLLPILSILLSTTSASFRLQPLCGDDESSALLQLKNSFVLNRYASNSSSSRAKTLSWTVKGRGDNCCLWDGIECDAESGHVIGLDISSSYLYGSITSSSSLFRLGHLQKLNLADNHFNYSEIPHEIGQLTALSYLNLSHSAFYGQVPHAISKLSKLVSLDLSHNDYNGRPMLGLLNPNLRRLVRNLTSLRELHLSSVYLSSPLPQLLANLSSLTSLILDNCGLQGTFPAEIFHLPRLQVLNVENNQNLTGQLPEFFSSSQLHTLGLGFTSFFSSLPASIGNLNSLAVLDVKASAFWGAIPSSFGNLTKLNYLNLAANNFLGPIPLSLANLTELTDLSFAGNKLSQESFSWLNGHPKLAHLNLRSTNIIGVFPSALQNYTQLTTLSLGNNRLSGLVPPWLPNVTKLALVYLNDNQFHGPIPRSIFWGPNLQLLLLQNNNLVRPLGVETFINQTKLKALDLGYNSLSLITRTDTNYTSKLTYLGLAGFKLQEFPGFLRNQDSLKVLDLSNNTIRGEIPEWIWKFSRRIMALALNGNDLTGSINSSLVPQLTSLEVLLLMNNKLQGTLPIPPVSLLAYSVTNNTLSGILATSICNLHSLEILDVSHNNFSGTVPPCIGNSSSYITVLNLQNNSLEGTIPWSFAQGKSLRMIDLNHNRFTGQIPRSLVQCSQLEKLDLSNNQISDTFPSWLGALSQLQVLRLRANKLYGGLEIPNTSLNFPSLRIIDLSQNELTGDLPSKYFENWNGMKAVQADQLNYMAVGINVQYGEQNTFISTVWLTYTMELGIKGTYMEHLRIPNTMIAIDLSNNRFEGRIPESITGLKALILLNVSNNRLSGGIPESTGNLTNLEAMDLSRNMLSGRIPPQLAEMNFLAYFDVSDNDLIGPIPQGTQFDTFPSTSFQGNSRLCGRPVSKPCSNRTESPGTETTSDEDDDDDSDSDTVIEWVIISLGFGSGIVIGAVLGNIFVERNDEWLERNIYGRCRWRMNQRRSRLAEQMLQINR